MEGGLRRLSWVDRPHSVVAAAAAAATMPAAFAASAASAPFEMHDVVDFHRAVRSAGGPGVDIGRPLAVCGYTDCPSCVDAADAADAAV
jgi:hypothetical protein